MTLTLARLRGEMTVARNQLVMAQCIGDVADMDAAQQRIDRIESPLAQAEALANGRHRRNGVDA